MKIAIITSLAGLPDSHIIDPVKNFSQPGQIDYYAFVDRLHSCRVWRQMPLPKFSVGDEQFRDRRNAKLPKVLGSLLVPGYDYYIWHDHCSEVVTDPKIIVSEYLRDNLIGLFRHTQRNCAYQELEVVGQREWDTKENLANIKQFLASQNFPPGQDLFELSAFVYKNCDKITEMMLTWWELIARYSSRDQISFPYVLHLHQPPCSILPGSSQQYGGNNPLIPQVRPNIKKLS